MENIKWRVLNYQTVDLSYTHPILRDTLRMRVGSCFRHLICSLDLDLVTMAKSLQDLYVVQQKGL